MLPENLVHTLLGTSINGATLALALYTIAIPYSKKALAQKAREEIELNAELLEPLFNGKAQGDQVVLSEEEKKKLVKTANKLKEHEKIPFYLNKSFGYVIFIGYMLSGLMALFWSIDYYKDFMDKYLILCFSIATIVFLIGGALLINDITKDMLLKYEDILNKLVKEQKNNH